MEIINLEVWDLDELPENVLSELNAKFLEEDELEITEFEQLLDYIRGAGNSSDSKDTNYIYTKWTLDSGDWRFETEGREYLKDHSICDMEYGDSIFVTSLKALKEKKEKADKKKVDYAKWESLFAGKTKEELFAILINKKFPKDI